MQSGMSCSLKQAAAATQDAALGASRRLSGQNALLVAAVNKTAWFKELLILALTKGLERLRVVNDGNEWPGNSTPAPASPVFPGTADGTGTGSGGGKCTADATPGSHNGYGRHTSDMPALEPGPRRSKASGSGPLNGRS